MKDELQEILDRCSEEMNDIESRIQCLPPTDRGKSYLTQYALIKASGTAEYVYRSIVADHFSHLANSRIDTFLDSTIRQGSMSATYDNMCKLLAKFDQKWSENFKTMVQSRSDNKKLIDASKSLVNNRHLFAHGKSPTATFLEIRQYFDGVKELIKILDTVVE